MKYAIPDRPDPEFFDPSTGQQIFAAEYYIGERAFVFHFWADGYYDAAVHLQAIQRRAELLGAVMRSEDMGGMQ